MLSDAKKNMIVMNKKIWNFSRKMQTIKKKQMEIWELETIIQAYLMLLCSATLVFFYTWKFFKKSLDGFNRRREMTNETMNLINGNYPTWRIDLWDKQKIQ